MFQCFLTLTLTFKKNIYIFFSGTLFYIDDVGKESFIHWNGPPVPLASNLLIKALNRHFKGPKWNFITRENKMFSTVTARLQEQKARVPFF